MTNPYWPLFDLRVRTPRLELRLPTDDDLVALAEAAADGIHDPDWMPFLFPWSTAPAPQLQRNVLQYTWRMRAEWAPEKWSANFAVVHEGTVVGTQGMAAEHFARLRTVDTGSWLTRSRQGLGLGKEMRAAVLQLAFAGLGAEVATTAAREDNVASLGVTQALGYEPNGSARVLFGDQAGAEQKFRLDRARWEQHTAPLYDVQVEGLDACRELFGC